MNDQTRLELLERMLMAAREFCRLEDWALPEKFWNSGPGNILAGLVRDIDALDAAPATAAEGETVRLAVWRWAMDGDIVLTQTSGAAHERNSKNLGWTRLGVVTLPIEKEAGV